MGQEKVKVTQDALALLKNSYKVIKVDGSFVGFCHNGNLEKLKSLDKEDIYEQLNTWGGTCNKKPGIKVCSYGAKNPSKVHNGGLNVGFELGNEIKIDIPDDRIVWMTKKEADDFKKEAENHEVFVPGNRYIDSTSPEMRKVIPKDKHLIYEGNCSIYEGIKRMSEGLKNLGVPVVEI